MLSLLLIEGNTVFSISLVNVLTMLFDMSSTDKEKSFMEIEDDGTHTVNAMVVYVHVSVSDFSDTSVNSEARDSVYVMYAGRHSIFYAHAYDEEGGHRRLNEVPVDEWYNTSNHDSCWRSDGFSFLNTLYFDMTKIVNDNKAPIELSDFTNLGISRNPVTKITVMLKTTKDGYHKDIVRVN